MSSGEGAIPIPAAEVHTLSPMSEWPWYSTVLAVLLGLYAVFIAGLLIFGRSRDVRALAGFVPDCIVLFKRLLRDPAIGRGRRAALVALVAYLLLPFDLVPDFIPVAGQLDDVVVTLLVLRFVLRGCPKGRL